jgi:endonuclease G, mitochondrial
MASLVGRGFSENFIGLRAPLPTFRPELADKVLRNDRWTNLSWTPYVHYSVATNAEIGQPICSAMNFDQSKVKSVNRKEQNVQWQVDSRIGAEFQLNNDYFRKNQWDRGHLTDRGSNAWGDTFDDAAAAAASTFSFANCALQHENHNQDEWRQLEEWVRGLTDDSNNRIAIYTGPIYGDPDAARRFVTPPGRKPAEVPAAFFKVIVYSDKNKKLAVRAFIIVQDTESLKDKNGKFNLNRRKYQVTVRDIEERTGLKFSTEIAAANPLFHSDTAGAARRSKYFDSFSHSMNEIASDTIGVRPNTTCFCIAFLLSFISTRYFEGRSAGISSCRQEGGHG